MSSEDSTQVFPKALEEIRRRLTELEEKVATRGYDTRPIFEAHERQIKELEAQVKALESKVSKSQMGGLTYIGWAYFTEGGDGPFCRHCYESSKGDMRAHLTGPDEDHYYHCTICDNSARDVDAPKSQRVRIAPPRCNPLAGY